MTQEAINIYNEGYYHYTGANGRPRDHKKAFLYFQKAAQLGVSEAMNYMGVMYEEGDCVPKDPLTAIKLFERALVTNPKNKYAAYNIGRLYYQGNGIQRNCKTAIDYFLKAAELGSSEAMNYLGIIYENGHFVDANPVKALEWYLKSICADKNNRRASHNIARMYYYGCGVQKNPERAYVYSAAAVRLGYKFLDLEYSKSCYLTGCILLEYYKLYHDAIGYFFTAAKISKIPEAWHNLGYMASNGLLPPELYGGRKQIDFHITARYFYEEAANLGYLPSMDELGRLNIIYQDMKTATYWLSKAAERGYEPSIKRMKMLRTADVLIKISDRIPSGNSSHRSSVISTLSNISDSTTAKSRTSNFAFTDSRGNVCTPGNPFYDYNGCLCEWGGPFHDFKGNYITPGSPFYDSKGHLCEWGSPFYDAQGHYIVP